MSKTEKPRRTGEGEVATSERVGDRQARIAAALERWTGALELPGGVDAFLDELRGER